MESNKVYQKKEYAVYKVKKEYIVHNTKKEFKEGHTHIKSFNMAKTIIDNCIRRKRPKTNNLYLLKSHSRVTNDLKYEKKIEELILTIKEREMKTKKYINAGGKNVRCNYY